MKDYINIKTLTLDELTGVVNLYPWYGAARKELCRRMAKNGGEGWGRTQFADAALYVAERKCVADIFRAGESTDWADKDMEKIVKSYIEQDSKGYSEERQAHVVGGDYFSQSQYDDVRKDEDKMFSCFAAKAEGQGAERTRSQISTGIYTETLAAIYAEQGYFDQAKDIYSKLLLKFPKKSSYFAALISELDKKTIN